VSIILAGIAVLISGYLVPADTTADAVLGQVDFATNAVNQPGGTPAADNLSLLNAAGIAVSSTGRLYISDPNNHRVLSWPNAATLVTGQSADMVFGQPGFTSSTPNNGGLSAGSLFLPQGLSVDEFGHLWVADAFNNRVLRFNDPPNDATPTTADLVIGQPDFTHNDQNLGNGDHGTGVALQDGLQFPGGVIVRWPDVFVADSGNSRVLHYNAPLANKPFADRVFGQYGDFTCRAKNNDGSCNNGCCASVDNLYNPIGLALDHVGRLYVADWFNNRILRFNNPLTSSSPDGVRGQSDFISNASDNGGLDHGLQLPIALTFDQSGRLYVADSGNNRVLVYFHPLTAIIPDAVLGQVGSLFGEDPNHGLGPAQTDANGLFGPVGIAIDGPQNCYVADVNNNRGLRFDRPFELVGDLNCDDVVDNNDVAAFCLALLDPVSYQVAHPGCPILRADVNMDGQINGRDVAAFVTLLLQP
jgi:sugar lactone lactonase YvrE